MTWLKRMLAYWRPRIELVETDDDGDAMVSGLIASFISGAVVGAVLALAGRTMFGG